MVLELEFVWKPEGVLWSGAEGEGFILSRLSKLHRLSYSFPKVSCVSLAFR